MKDKNAKARMQVIFGSLLFALTGSAELYAMINYSGKYLVIAGIAILSLGCLYVAIAGIFTMKDQKALQWEERYDSIFKSEKASYLLLKKYFGEIEDKLTYLEQVAKIPTEEIVNAQKGVAKVVINRSRENTEALMNSNDLITEQISEFDTKLGDLAEAAARNQQEIESTRDAVSSTIQSMSSMLESVKNAVLDQQRQSENSSEKTIQANQQEMIVSLKDMELRLNQLIMQSMKNVQTPIVQAAPIMASAPVMQTVSVPAAESNDEPVVDSGASILQQMEQGEMMDGSGLDDVSEPVLDEVEEETDLTELDSVDMTLEDLPELDGADLTIEDVSEFDSKDTTLEDLPEIDGADLTLDDTLELDTADITTEDHSESATELEIGDMVLEDIPDMTVEETEENPVEDKSSIMPDLSDPNKQLNPDEIAALLANMGVEDEQGQPITSVETIEESEIVPESEIIKESEIVPESEMIEESGIVLESENIEESEIVSESETIEESEIVPEAETIEETETIAEPEMIDESQITADPEPVVESEPESAAAAMPDLTDPNKQLSADEIAALFANMGV